MPELQEVQREKFKPNGDSFLMVLSTQLIHTWSESVSGAVEINIFNTGDTGISVSSVIVFGKSMLKNNELDRINEREHWPVTCSINCWQNYVNECALGITTMGKIWSGILPFQHDASLLSIVQLKKRQISVLPASPLATAVSHSLSSMQKEVLTKQNH